MTSIHRIMSPIASLVRRSSLSRGSATAVVLALAASTAHAQDWIERPDMRAPRGALSAQAIGTRIHVIGGDLTWGGGNMSTRNDVYDTTTHSWWSVPAAPVPHMNTWGSASAVLGPDIYLLGGHPQANQYHVYHS